MADIVVSASLFRGIVEIVLRNESKVVCVSCDVNGVSYPYMFALGHRLLYRPSVDVLKARLHVVETKKFFLGHTLAVIRRRRCRRVGGAGAKCHGHHIIED